MTQPMDQAQITDAVFTQLSTPSAGRTQPTLQFRSWRTTTAPELVRWTGQLRITDAVFLRLTTPKPIITGLDAITWFIRQKMQEDGFFRMLFPAIPVGAPWWETGWRITQVIKQVRFHAEEAEALACRTMDRERWKRWYGRNRATSREAAAERDFQRKLVANMIQLGRVSLLIRNAGRKECEVLHV
jgi:hypothetical protein